MYSQPYLGLITAPTIIKVEVDPPVFSDHSLITAEIMIGDHRDIERGSAVTVTRRD